MFDEERQSASPTDIRILNLPFSETVSRGISTKLKVQTRKLLTVPQIASLRSNQLSAAPSSVEMTPTFSGKYTGGTDR